MKQTIEHLDVPTDVQLRYLSLANVSAYFQTTYVSPIRHELGQHKWIMVLIVRPPGQHLGILLNPIGSPYRCALLNKLT
jgi:hypothetical protein